MQQALDQLARLYASLAALRREMEPINPRNFAVLAEGHLDDIRRLQQELDEYAGVVAADRQAAALWLRVVGREIEWHSAPTSVLTAILDAFRKGVQSVAELSLTGELSTRPTAALKQAADFRIVALAPGSLRLGIRPPGDESEAGTAVIQALGEYISAAAWVASDAEEGDFIRQVPDMRRRQLLLTQLARLVPRERGQVEQVELSGRFVQSQRSGEVVTLSRQSRLRINAALDRIPESRVETHVGDLREIDLDRCTFVLRNAEEVVQLECEFGEELLEAAKDALDKRVEVTGSRSVDKGRRARPLHVTRLEIVEESAS
jgi:hypothetical protein